MFVCDKSNITVCRIFRFVFFLFVLTLWAGRMPLLAMPPGVNVHPLLLDLNDAQRNAAITVANGESSPELMRVEVKAWDQDQGEDHYAPSDDLLVVPPVLSIAPQQEKFVRLGLRHPVSAGREQAYRVFVTEVPSAITLKKGALVQVAFRIGVPIFVNAVKLRTNVQADGAATWKASIIGAEKIRLTVSNAAASHIRIDGMKIFRDASKTKLLAERPMREYVLAGVTRSFTLNAGALLNLPTVEVLGSGIGGTFEVVVPVAKF
jgi:fimbrial chaperone protein